MTLVIDIRTGAIVGQLVAPAVDTPRDCVRLLQNGRYVIALRSAVRLEELR